MLRVLIFADVEYWLAFRSYKPFSTIYAILAIPLYAKNLGPKSQATNEKDSLCKQYGSEVRLLPKIEQ